MSRTDTNNLKCVIVVDGALPRGIIANTSAILGISLGRLVPEAVGRDVCDKSGCVHSGIIEFPVPVLNGTAEQLDQLRKKLYAKGFEDVAAVDFSDIAQSCKTYDEFAEKLSRTDEGSLRYFGIGLCGEAKKVNRLTGNLPLLKEKSGAQIFPY
ncbi:MAG: DUF2000 domain-containing protein [Oscillospiraceae bacterium]|nr:DUF2000 domain-containing protein [Oscillospiraceae bacterium]